VLTKQGLKAGDQLILTKPLGTGIVNTAIKGGLASEEVTRTVTRLMAALNRDAAEVMRDFPVTACTDITGFGLVGHLAEMLTGTGLGVRIFADRLPTLPEAIEYAGMGLVPAGAFKNREFRQAMTEISDGVDRFLADLLFDPQTSGGLLMSVSAKQAEQLVNALRQQGLFDAAIIGQAVSGGETIQVTLS
jgi:selenide,water dikinase